MPVKRGQVIDAVDDAPMDHLRVSLTACWARVAELCAEWAEPLQPVHVMAEIWPDTGRIIWILRDRCEMGRLELKAVEIEKAYFNLPSSAISVADFDAAYSALITHLKQVLRDTLPQEAVGREARIVVRDSDVRESEDVLAGR